MPPDRDRANLHDMLSACRRVAAFIGGMSAEVFRADARTQSAVLHQLLILGEACKRLSAGFRESHPSVPWALIARTRDILIHHYENVDLDEVWRIAVRDVPAVMGEIQRLADEFPAADS